MTSEMKQACIQTGRDLWLAGVTKDQVIDQLSLGKGLTEVFLMCQGWNQCQRQAKGLLV